MEIQDFLIAALQNITVLISQSEDKISKSTAQIGHVIRTQRAKWEDSSFGSLLIRLFNQFTMALGLA
jgi:hypothetical protein